MEPLEPLGPWVDWVLGFGWLVVGYGAIVMGWLVWNLVTGGGDPFGAESDVDRRAGPPGRRASDRRC